MRPDRLVARVLGGLLLTIPAWISAPAWAAVEGYYLPGKEPLEFRYMFVPVPGVSIDPTRWDVWTAPDGQTRYLQPQRMFGNADIEGILISSKEGARGVGDIADYDIQVRLTVTAWQRSFRVRDDRQGYFRPVLLIGGRLIEPPSIRIEESVQFSLARTEMSAFLNALTPAPQPTESVLEQYRQWRNRKEQYWQWLSVWVNAHPDDFSALSSWTSLALDRNYGGHGCDALIELLDRYLQGLAKERAKELAAHHPDAFEGGVDPYLVYIVPEIQGRLRAHGRDADEPKLIALLQSSPGLSEKGRDLLVKHAAKAWEDFENADRKDPRARLLEQFDHLMFEHDDCDGAQAVVDQLFQLNDAKMQEDFGGFAQHLGGCFLEQHRIADIEAVLARLKASNGKDKANDIAVLEDMIAQAKAAPAAPSSEAKP